MFHFIKYQGTWYLKAEKLEDIISHFKVFCSREIRESLSDFAKYARKSQTSGELSFGPVGSWNTVVTMLIDIQGGSWLSQSLKLEDLTFRDRIKAFQKGHSVYLRPGMQFFSLPEPIDPEDEICLSVPEYPGRFKYSDLEVVGVGDGKWEIQSSSDHFKVVQKDFSRRILAYEEIKKLCYDRF